MNDDQQTSLDAEIDPMATDEAITIDPVGDPDASTGEVAPALTGAARLVLKRGGAETDIEFPFVAPAVVGRFDPTVGPIDIDLGSLTPEGSYISRRHARITLEDGVFILEDLQSSNGTYILQSDFEKIETAPLTDGTELAFGNARFVFKLA
jgi:hypothetical protein